MRPIILIVTRPFLPAALLAATLAASDYAQKPSEVPPPPPDQPAAAQSGGTKEQAKPPQPDYAEPAEEDVTEIPRAIEFNPIEAEKDITAGKFYLKKGTASALKAALNRFDEATKYNPASAEAFLLLGEVSEKVKDPKRARAAYQRVIDIDPKARIAGEARKRLARLDEKR
jgi:tetratricopeptide (TPR) repeat protein